MIATARVNRRFFVLLVAGLVGLTIAAPRAQQITLAEALERTADYVAAFNRDLSSIVAEERYTQTWRTPPLKGRSVDSLARRELLSDLILVKAGDDSVWVQYRDVFQVDGSPVRDRVERLTSLFVNPSAAADNQIARIQRESARLNLGNIERNLNTPVFALQFLTRENQSAFKFKRTEERRSAAVNDAAADTGAFRVSTEVWVVQFEESARPTIVQTANGRDVPARGRF
jgi:hypothetical protein